MRARSTAVIALVALLLSMLPTTVAGAPSPTISLADLVVTEPSGRSGVAPIALPVVLDVAPAGPVVVSWRTVTGSAGASDFVAASGSFTINAGSQGGGLPLDIRADRTAEPTESFTVELTAVTGAAIGDGVGRVDIRDASTGLAVADATVLEPDAGGVDLTIPVTVPSAPNKPVTFTWELRAGTASIGSDVVAATGSGVISKGTLSSIIFVRVSGDVVVEAAEWFEIVVTSVKNAALSDGVGRVTLLDDDVPPPTPTPSPTPTATPTPPPTATPTPLPTGTAPPISGWQPPAGAVPATGTVVYLQSEPGDYIGQGESHLDTLATAILAFDAAGDRFSVHVRGDRRWDGWFAPQASGTPIAAGTYPNLRRYGVFVPGLSWTGEGRGCNESMSHLVIDEWTGSTTDPDRIVARFEQRCDASVGVLRGFIRYERDDPSQPPPPGDAANFPWSPPAASVPATGDYFYFESSPGDYIGQGRTDLYTAPDSTLIGSDTNGVVRLRVDRGTSDWDVRVSGPDAQTQLQSGLYEDLGRYPFHNPVEGGLSMSGEGRGCNELAGAFAVDSAVYDAGGLASFEVRFVQRCEVTNPPLYGAMRWTRPGN